MSSGLMGVGRSALMAAYAQLQTTGHNIANAATPGFSRQEAVNVTAGADFTGAGYIGRGVNVGEVRRRYDRFVADEVAAGTAAASADQARAAQVERLESLFADPEAGVGAAFDAFNSALADVADRPTDLAARTVALSRADGLAARVRELDAGVSEVGATIEGRLQQGVRSANDAFTRLAHLNEQMMTATAAGRAPNDLLDTRDALLGQINQSLRATFHVAENGTVNVFSAGGQGLVVGTRAARLSMQPDATDATRSQVTLQADGASIPMSAASLAGGELSGLLRARDDDLAAVRARVGQMAGAVAGAFNRQQQAGVDLRGAPGEALFATGAPQAAAAAINQGSAAFSVSVSDASRLKASDYRIDFDGASYRVTRLADDQEVAAFAPPAAGAPIRLDSEGLALKLDSGTSTAGDRFAVRSASVLAAGLQRTLRAPEGLAAAVSMVPQVGASNAGSVQVQAFSADPAATGASASLAVRFSSPTTYDVPGATPPVAGAAYTPGQPIRLAGWSMTLAGTPVAGDTVTVLKTAVPATDNRNARELVALSRAPLVDGSSVTDAYGAAIAEVGARSQSAQATGALSQRLLDAAQAARADVSGVNLDEEAARLLQHQQAYQAAAKVIQTAQSMFDSLLQTMN